MSIDEIFSAIATHMVQGTMTHEQLMNSYLFLGLNGYAACHEYHYISESKGYAEFCKYVATRHGKLISLNEVKDPGIIPESWKTSVRDDVDISVRAQAMKAALSEWIDWELDTVKLYSEMYKELMAINEVGSADFLNEYILDAEKEYIFAKNEMIKKTAMDFDITSIIEEQDAYERKFTKKMK